MIEPEPMITLTAEVRRLSDAFEELGRALGLALMPALQQMANAWRLFVPADLLPPDEYEKAARAYARRYNWRHAGRRVSWRRLSRPQRAAAYQMWKDGTV